MRVDATGLQQVDIHDSIHSAEAVLSAELGSGIEVTRDYAPDLPAVVANPAELNQVFFSLLTHVVTTVHRPMDAGLGLFVSRRIVENHGGTTRFDRSPSGGGTLAIALPVQGPGSCGPTANALHRCAQLDS